MDGEPTVFRPSTGGWYSLNSSTNYATSYAQVWGIGTDIPVAGDYDGDGKTDPAFTLAENLVDPQRWNRYVYVRTNPLRYVDPDGRDRLYQAVMWMTPMHRYAQQHDKSFLPAFFQAVRDHQHQATQKSLAIASSRPTLGHDPH